MSLTRRPGGAAGLAQVFWGGGVAWVRWVNHDGGLMSRSDPDHPDRSDRSAGRVGPGTLIDLAVQLHRDEGAPSAALRERDRRIGLEQGAGLEGESADDTGRAKRLARWLGALPDPPRGGAAALATVGVAAALMGLLLGYGAARAVYWYDGREPVNVVRVLGVFVVLQAVTLGLFAVAARPGRGGLSEALLALSPGRWAGFVTRWLPAETREALAQVTGRGGAHQMLYGRVQKWQVLAWSQSLALAFNVGALVGALQLIVGSDLAFGWSTTLPVEAPAMHGLTQVLSAPWGWAWPAAAPGVELIAETRTFRMESFEVTTQAERFTEWWPFLLMCMAVYGLLPRVITWWIARRRLGEAATRSLALTPGADAVLRRMDRPQVQTRATEHEVDAGGEAAEPLTEVEASRAVCVVRWSEAPGTGSPLNDGATFDAGGRSTLEDDRGVIRAAARYAARSSDRVAVALRVKAWEPPLGELLDFLRELRGALGQGTPIEVHAVGTDGGAAREQDRAVWRAKLATVGDPWLRVVGDGNGDGGGGDEARQGSAGASPSQGASPSREGQS